MKCPFCGEPIQPDALKCRFCRTRLKQKNAEIPILPGDRPLGKDRDMLSVVLLMFFTFGIYQMYHAYAVGKEINLHSGEQKLNPLLHVILLVLTCGLWAFGLSYCYLKAFYEMQLAEGLKASDNRMLCIIGVWGLILMQQEMNQHWALHQEQGKAS